MKVYVERLKNTYDAYQKKIEEASSIDDLAEIYNESVGCYLDMIPSFFSSRGEGKNIRDMYKKMQDHQYSRFMLESTIENVDLNFAGKAYKDYLSGMNQFITDICDFCVDGELYATESVSCKEKLNRALSNDGEFIESIFGGSNNPKSAETMMETTKNIEYLISFMEDMRDECTQCGVTIDEVKKGIQNHVDSAGLLTESTRLMINSVNNYINHTLSVVFESYDKMNEILDNGGTPKPKTEKKKGLQVF